MERISGKAILGADIQAFKFQFPASLFEDVFENKLIILEHHDL